MHRRAVTCNMCGKAFFPASLKIHTPQCLKKQQMMYIPCSYCNNDYRRVEMPDHLKKCSAARKHRKKAAAHEAKQERARAEAHQRSLSADYYEEGSGQQYHSSGGRNTRGGFAGSGGGAQEFRSGGGGGGGASDAFEAQFGGDAGDTFGRVPCRYCGRKFDGARIGKHQGICAKLKHGPPKQVKAGSGVGLGAAARQLPSGAGVHKPKRQYQRDSSTRHAHQSQARPQSQQLPTRDGNRRSADRSPQRGRTSARSGQYSQRTTPAAAAAAAAGGGGGGGGGGGEAFSTAHGGSAPKNKTSWRTQRAQLREAMKAGRQMTRFEKGLTDVMPEVKPSAPDPSLVACPHCNRTFSESAAERHIPICKNLIHTRPKPVRKSPSRAHNTASNFTGKTQLDNANKWGGAQTARAARGGQGGIAKGNHTSRDNPIFGQRGGRGW